MKTTKLFLPLFFTTLLLHADEFDMFDTVDEVDSSKSAFQEDETFMNAREYKQSLMPKRKLYEDIEPIRIERIEPLRVYTIRHVGEYEKLDETWEKIMQFAGRNRLFSDEFYAYAIAYDNPDISNNNRLRYDACISATKEIKLKNKEIRTKVLDGGKYAVFLHI